MLVTRNCDGCAVVSVVQVVQSIRTSGSTSSKHMRSAELLMRPCHLHSFSRSAPKVDALEALSGAQQACCLTHATRAFEGPRIGSQKACRQGNCRAIQAQQLQSEAHLTNTRHRPVARCQTYRLKG